jgi:uncharacterized membrane protein (UPF0136 family)
MAAVISRRPPAQPTRILTQAWPIIVASAVEERRREIGLRMALGARAGQVVRFVLATSQASILAGVALGRVVAIAPARGPRGPITALRSKGTDQGQAHLENTTP